MTKLGIIEYEYKYESRSPSPYILFLNVTLLFPIITSSIMSFHSLFSSHYTPHSPPSLATTLSKLPFPSSPSFHHPIVPSLSFVIPIVITWWSFVIWTKPSKQFLLIQNFYQDNQIKTSYKSMSHLEMSLGTSFQNMDLATLGTT